MIDYSKITKVDKSLTLEQRILFLQYCAKRYENFGDSPISDKQYDEEYNELLQLAPEHPFFDEIGGLIEAELHGTRVKHEVLMGSLNKSPSPEEALVWLKNQYKGIKDPQFLLQLKIDGLSLSLHYDNNGNFVQAITRGDGTTGILAPNAKYVDGVLPSISHKGKIEIRGECFKDRKEFFSKYHKSVGGVFANPRNFTPGSLLQHDPEITKERHLSFIAYEVIGIDFADETEKNMFLEKMGFYTLNKYTKTTKKGISFDQIYKAIKYFMDSIDRYNLPFDIDGIVVKNCDIKMAKSMGSTSNGRKPKSNHAIKFPPEEKVTKIVGLDINVNRTGIISPVAILEPVELGGAMISRVTLYNFNNVINNKELKIGSLVAIQKKGDIIPAINYIQKAGNKDFDIPKNCPCCGSILEWDSTKINLLCKNPTCSAQLASAIVYWFEKLGVKGIGMGILSKLTDKNILEWEGHAIIETLPEIYYMLDFDKRSEHPFRKYAYLKEQFGEKAFSNIVDNIKSVKDITLCTFIQALGIGRIGSMAKDITDIAPTIDDIDKLTENDISNIHGFGPIKAKSFIYEWKTRKAEINQLLQYINIKKPEISSNKLSGNKFCFTGSFSKSRDELEKLVEQNGGTASSSVGKNVILCWDGEETGNKYNKAVKSGNKIISEKEFFKMIE